MKKKAEDLKPGDVIPENEAYGPRVVLSVGPSSTYSLMVVVRFFGLWADAIDATTVAKSAEFEVESPALSPAQQHAEELLELVRGYGKLSLSGWENSALELLARIDPPKPPSAEELAEALDDLREAICTGDSTNERNRADAILRRARAAGMLKDPQ